MTAKKKAAPKRAAPKRAARPKLEAVPVGKTGIDVRATAPAVEGFAQAAGAAPEDFTSALRGWRVKHHMTKFHNRPDEENPFLHLAATGACVFCGGLL